MMKQTALPWFIPLILANFGADRISKYLAREYLPRGEEVQVLGSFFVLRYTENRGAFLSMGSALPVVLHLLLLKVFPALLIILMLWYALFKSSVNRMQLIALGCVIGGGMGNLADRFFRGDMVSDFLLFRLGALRTGVLNIADLSITIGCILLFFTFLPGKEKGDPL